MSGTSGQAKRLEAIQIRLTGEMANRYDVYYRVHAQHFGWMGWAKNGASAGTAGYSYRLEGIQIVLVNKGGSAPGKTFGGQTQWTATTFAENTSNNAGGQTNNRLNYANIYGRKLDELMKVRKSGTQVYGAYDLYDLDGNGVKELFVYDQGGYSGAMSTFTMRVFTYKNGTVVEAYSLPRTHGSFRVTRGAVIYQSMQGVCTKYRYQNTSFSSGSSATAAEWNAATDLSFGPGNELENRTKLKNA